ncbi:MAG: diacylglycerol kinase family protein [Trueperaceae bacterium]
MDAASLGLIVNPTAGLGALHGERAARAAIAALRPRRVLAGAGALGENAVDDADRLELVSPDGATGRAATQALAVATARAGVDVLVVVGGDGTLADAALALHLAGLRCPLLGVGTGSTNAGALVTCRAEKAATLAPARLRARPVAGLRAQVGDVVALAFNDVVVGTTVVGTLDGDFVDLDAAAYLRGERRRGRPVALACAEARVVRRGPDGDLLVAAGDAVGGVVVGFTDKVDAFGQALVGGVSLSRWVGVPAGCLVSSFPLVFAGYDRTDHRRMEPLRTAYVGLAPEQEIELTGLGAGAFLCADGNPLRALAPGDVARVRVLPGVVDVVRMDEGPQ